MADNETTTDIIAWLRKPREGENAYLTLWRDEIADRLEAAHKRERGDCTKLREALKAIGGLCDRLMPTWDGSIGRIKDITEAALSAPPRNCDVMDWRTAWKMWREKFHPETPVGYSAVVKGTEAFMDWFTAPATEKEGGVE